MSEIVTVAVGFVGVGLGYLIGFRSGRTAGELAALKAQRSRRGGRDYRSPGSTPTEGRVNEDED